ncbi:MAG TPA: SRPBCC family protein [Chloroflexota bacterium]|nr:SRPBCC family protein [Chloroflexota bacterium]
MSAATRSSFVYVTAIRTTPERLWAALTDPALIRRYWFGAIVECDWKRGSPWRKTRADGRLTDTGEILEIDPPRRMVMRWQGEWKPEYKAEGPSRCTLALEPVDGAVKLTSTHEMERPESTFIRDLSEGWPLVLSNLKSLLETGEVAMT